LRPSFCWCGVRIGLRPNLMPLASTSARSRAVHSRVRRRSVIARETQKAGQASGQSPGLRGQATTASDVALRRREDLIDLAKKVVTPLPEQVSRQALLAGLLSEPAFHPWATSPLSARRVVWGHEEAFAGMGLALVNGGAAARHSDRACSRDRKDAVRPTGGGASRN
jgi:hypothetical protein